MTTTTIARGAPASAPPSPGSTVDERQLDEVVGTVSDGRARWAATPVRDRIALLDRILDDTLAAAPDWVADACRAKGIAPGTPPVGEEWHSGPALLARNARLFRDSLRDIERTGRPQLPGKLRSGPDGRVVGDSSETLAGIAAMENHAGRPGVLGPATARCRQGVTGGRPRS